MDTSKNIISISHNDLDGVGCNLVLKFVFKDVYFKTVSYSNILATFRELQDGLIYDKNKSMVVLSDISLKIEECILLKEICNTNKNVKFVYVDHHIRTKEISDILKTFPSNFQDVYNIKQSSALTLKLYFGANHKYLSNIITLINIYDLWLTNDELFKDALVFNEVFEVMGYKEFFNELSSYRITPKLEKKIQKQQLKIDTFFDTIKDKNIYYDDDLCIAYIDKNKSLLQYTIDKSIIIIISSNLNFSIRLSNNLTDVQIIEITNNFFDYFNKNKIEYYYAHKQVFGFNSSQTTIYNDIDNIISFIKTIKLK